MAITAISRPVRVGFTGASVVGLLAASHAAADVPFSAVSALLPTLQIRFGLTESALALLIATLSFAASLTQPLLGAVADRVGGRVVGAGGVIASSVLLSLVGVVPSFGLLLGLLLTGGLASAAMHPAFTSIARRHGGPRPGLAVSLYSAGGTLGVAVGPLAVLALMSAFGVGGTPWLMVPGVALGIATYILIPGDTDEAEHGPALPWRLLAGPVGVLTLALTLAGVPYIAFMAAMPLWLVTEHGVARDHAVIGWTLSAFALSAAVGGVVGGSLVGRVPARVSIPTSLLLAVLPLTAVLGSTPGTPGYFLAVLLAGGLLNASLPIAVVTAQDLAPRSVATASGLLMGLTRGIAGLLYLGVGALQEQVGITASLLVTVALLPLAAAIAFAVLSTLRLTAARGQIPLTGCPCPV